MMTTEVTFAPNAKTIIGARAMIGTVWLAITYGTKARSSNLEWTNAVARTSPRSAPRANPINASRHVYSAASKRNWATFRSAPRCHGWPKARTMFQTWGRLRSFAKGRRSGGFQIAGEPGPAPGARHGTPPMNLSASQTTRMAIATSANVKMDRRLLPAGATAGRRPKAPRVDAAALVID